MNEHSTSDAEASRTATTPTSSRSAEAAYHTFVSLVTLDRDCRIVGANPAAQGLAGAAERALVGWRFCEMYCAAPCNRAADTSCLFGRALQGLERRSHPRWTALTTQGIDRSALVGATSLRMRSPSTRPVDPGQGAVVTIVPSALVDNADQRRREMIAGAVHDLRHSVTVQSLSIEMLHAQTLQDHRLEPQTDAALQRLRRTTAQLTTGLDDLMNRALFDLVDVALHPRAVNVLTLVQQVVWHMEPLLQRRNQRARVSASPDIQTWVDPTALEHITMNLLLNAHKYSGAGDEISITARRLPRIQMIELAVRDHGPGVPPAERRRVFDRFYRGAGSGDQRGAGLGLTIVRTLVVRQGGSVGMRGGRKGGSVFWLRLPAYPRYDRHQMHDTEAIVPPG